MINQKSVQPDIIQQTTIRFKFYKKEEFKYLSHLDIIRILCRALNRAGFNVAYSSGYNPKPKIKFSAPTPLGIESFAEYGEVTVNDNINGNEFKERMIFHGFRQTTPVVSSPSTILNRPVSCLS